MQRSISAQIRNFTGDHHFRWTRIDHSDPPVQYMQPGFAAGQQATVGRHLINGDPKLATITKNLPQRSLPFDHIILRFQGKRVRL